MDKRTYLGLYRGICVDPRDVEQRGRIKVIVPQVTGDSAVLVAWPCHRVRDDFRDVPQDPPKKGLKLSPNLPPTSSGVWVMYEGGDPNKPVWIGVF